LTVSGALEGIKVLELANYVSGPFAGVLLSDLGADVIKIEEPKHGDPFRGWGAAEYSPTFGSVNRNKKSVTLDLKTKEGVETALRLADQADVLIENFRTGTLDRLGLGYDTVSKRNPRLIYCSITGFGRTGPYANRAGYDTVGQAMSGLLGLLTDRSAPQPMGISLSDHLTGMVASYGILGALMARTHTGKGQRVETSLLQATMSLLGENAARYFENGEVPARATRARSAQVFGFVGSDGKPFVVHLSSPPKFWEGLANVVGHPEWIKEERFINKDARRKAYKDLYKMLQDIFATQPRDHWLKKLLEADVPSGPIYDFNEVFEDPQVKHLGMRVDVPHPLVGSVGLVGSGVTFSDTPARITRAAPALGADNEAVLASLKKQAAE
jgi:crotonobetainyl-CoA:carnitine CoA-transferase CaiB-like acyl-CoA transferase